MWTDPFAPDINGWRRMIALFGPPALLAGLVILTLAFSGCASIALPSHPQPQSLGEALANVRGDLVIDLSAADVIAVAHGDVVAHACYPVLAKYVPGNGAPTVDQIKGVFSAFEEARATRLKVEGQVAGGIPTDLKLACAALLMDEQQFILRLAAIAGGSSVGVPGLGSLIPR
jgi:hypothetical protein